MGAPLVLHASCIAYLGKAVLITGASGAGKSSLALELMAFGAALVADDRTELQSKDGQVIATCPPTIQGRIEVRQMGILRADYAGATPVALIVDLDRVETDRLPPLRSTELCGLSLPVLHKIGSGPFSAAILQYLKSGREDEGYSHAD